MPWPTEDEQHIDAFLQLVTQDVSDALAPLFEPPDPADPASGIQFPDDVVAELPYSDTFAAIPWMWVGTHTGRVPDPSVNRGENFPVRDPTGKVVVIEGLSLLQRIDGDEVYFHRYVDWLGAYQQLGLLMSGRTPLDVQVAD